MDPRKPSRKFPTALTPYIVGFLALVMTLVSTAYVTHVGQIRAATAFGRWVQRTQDDIQAQIDLYTALLRSTSGLFLTDEDVTWSDFHHYADALSLREKYPGIRNIGFALAFHGSPSDVLPPILQREGVPSLETWSLAPGPEHDVVLYVQPYGPRTSNVMGYDMASDPQRLEVLHRARDTGEPAATGNVHLVGAPAGPGFLMVMPVYHGAVTPDTLADRRQNIQGYAITAFRLPDLLDTIIRNDSAGYFDFDIYDSGVVDPAHLVYRFHTGEAPVTASDRQSQFTTRATVHIADRPWTLAFHSRPEFEAAYSEKPEIAGTIVVGLFVAGLLFWLTRSEARARISAQQAALELSESERSLRASEERYRLASAASNDVILDWDLLQGRVIWNDALHTALGYPEGRMQTTGQWWTERVHPADRAQTVESLHRAITGSDLTWTREYRFSRAGGGFADVLDRRFIARDDTGRAVRVIGAMLDLTQRKADEKKLKNLNETLEQRVATRTASLITYQQRLRSLAAELTLSEQRERRRLSQVLHDHLQQLLVAALMRVGMVQRRTTDNQATGTLKQVADLLNESIDAARSLTIELSPPMLYERGLVPALDLLRRKDLEKYGLKIELHADPAAEPAAEDIRVLLFQATRELLFNIVKHAGVDTATITLQRIDDRVRLTVADEGAGFDPDRLGQGQPAGGFGLFSMRERLQMLGGAFTVDSAPGRGTRITLEAPVGQSPTSAESAENTAQNLAQTESLAAATAVEAPFPAEPTPAEGPAAPNGARPPGKRRVRVLLADDHKMFREGLATLLREQGDIEVVAQAADGAAAVELAHRTRPHVVVMDVTMPRLNGIEATRRIRRDLPEVRVIGLSMHDDQGMVAAMHDAGAADYIPKGSPSDALIAAIRGN